MMLLKFVSFAVAALAVVAVSAADIPKRDLTPELATTLKLRSGIEERCSVKSWSGEMLEGSCGVHRWEEVKPDCVLALLRKAVKAGDATAVADATAIVLSQPDADDTGKIALEWAKRNGVKAEQIDAVRKAADALVVARKAFESKRDAARLSTLSPEAATFAATRWKALTPAEFAVANNEMVEAARAALARAGGSGTLHVTTHIGLLAESGGDEFREAAAALEVMYERWAKALVDAGAQVMLQGRIPVIIVADKDRWRLLVASATNGDPAKHTESLVVYPVSAPNGPARAMVLVAPNSDIATLRFHAAVGVARAMLHYSVSPQRGPAWLNEGLPRVMAAVHTPLAAMDDSLRKAGLPYLRGGGSFAPLMASSYSDGAWTGDDTLARSLSYMFVRWLYDQNPRKLFEFAKATNPAEPVEKRFRATFGISLENAGNQAARWFYTND